MNLTAWIDVAIGLSLVYLGASLFVTVINEYIAQTLNLRGRSLAQALVALIGDKDVQDLLRRSPAIKPFFEGKVLEAPSYVDPKVLSRLLVGGLAARSGAATPVEQVADALGRLPDSALRTQLLALVRTVGQDANKLVAEVGEWADRSLTALGEGYKRNLQKISFGVGLVVAVVLNLDTVALTTHLYRDKDARDAAVALGVQIAEKTDKAAFDKCMALPAAQRRADAACVPLSGLIETVQARNASIGQLPIGWPLPDAANRAAAGAVQSEALAWPARLLGWVLTAIALSLGAPFWFDLLNRLVNVRHGMRRPEVAEGKSGG